MDLHYYKCGGKSWKDIGSLAIEVLSAHVQ